MHMEDGYFQNIHLLQIVPNRVSYAASSLRGARSHICIGMGQKFAHTQTYGASFLLLTQEGKVNRKVF